MTPLRGHHVPRPIPSPCRRWFLFDDPGNRDRGDVRFSETDEHLCVFRHLLLFSFFERRNWVMMSSSLLLLKFSPNRTLGLYIINGFSLRFSLVVSCRKGRGWEVMIWLFVSHFFGTLRRPSLCSPSHEILVSCFPVWVSVRAPLPSVTLLVEILMSCMEIVFLSNLLIF